MDPDTTAAAEGADQGRGPVRRGPGLAPRAVAVGRWTGVEVWALRNAARLSTRAFADRLGVSARAVGHWEAKGAAIAPSQFSQGLLDTFLAQASVELRARFLANLTAPDKPVAATATPMPEPSSRPRRRVVDVAATIQATLQREDMRAALAVRDVTTVFRILTSVGVSQRQLAARTDQSQSEISEILGGRRVIAYDLLARIADGLQIERGHMGLAETNRAPARPGALLVSRLEEAATQLHQAAVALLRALGDDAVSHS